MKCEHNKIPEMCQHCNKINMSKTWQERFDEEFNIYQGEYSDLISAPEVMIKQFISDLRKRDMEALIGMLSDNCSHNEDILISEAEKLIKDYYEK